ncbi:MAG: prephenate dehydrogenase [Halanaeroarchaeum sp.]
MEALIVGAGDVGRWFARLWDGPVAFADADRDVATEAAASTADARVAAMDDSTRFALVCVAVPMDVATSVIEEQGSRAERAVVDCTGSMREPLSAMADVAPGTESKSYHPLYAPDHGPGRIAASVGESGPVTDAVDEAMEAAGNELVPVDPEVHDEAMQTIQGRAHAAILAFGLASESVPEDLATPVYEDLDALRERVTDGSPAVYADIQEAFDGAADVADAASRIAEADGETFAALFDDAG